MLGLQVMREIVHAAKQHQNEDSVGAIIITGEGSKAFAAGADIKEMSTQGYSQVCRHSACLHCHAFNNFLHHFWVFLALFAVP